ncbi:kinase-like domain-containing protein [Triangularia verruculosa]|uniref:Kinase-like domain-containing protein n=1 Tax=Triangularia verruculosa TaxID=2587418 RepID=A0AAN6XTY4_9PEZI|nr:kinase-like domain-containing protein [Triangularia verruculosa]
MLTASGLRRAHFFRSPHFIFTPSRRQRGRIMRCTNRPPTISRNLPLGPQHLHRTMSSRSTPSRRQPVGPLPRRTTPFAVGEELRGKSGIAYRIEEVLAERQEPLLCVYRASDNQAKSYIVKNLLPGHFEYRYQLQQGLTSCPNLRIMADAIPEHQILIYPFLDDTLLRVCQKELSTDVRKGMIKSALTGLAELHDRLVVHTDIKPNNILVNYEEAPTGILTIKSVKISDLEDAVQLEPDQNLLACLYGNQLWRSPESWLRAEQNTPSDIFSFAITAIYVMLNEMVFLVPEEERVEGHEAWKPILMRHVSYFGDNDGFQGFLEHIGEKNADFDAFIDIALQVKPRRPFAGRHYLDSQFRDLITKMTSLDPNKRITAREALKHAWFEGTD